MGKRGYAVFFTLLIVATIASYETTINWRDDNGWKREGLESWSTIRTGGNDVVEVHVSIKDDNVFFRLEQKCFDEGSRVSHRTLEWRFRERVAKLRECDGSVDGAQQIPPSHEQQFAPFPEKIEKLLDVLKQSHRAGLISAPVA